MLRHKSEKTLATSRIDFNSASSDDAVDSRSSNSMHLIGPFKRKNTSEGIRSPRYYEYLKIMELKKWRRPVPYQW